MLNYEGPQNQKILWGPRFIIPNSEFIIHPSLFTIHYFHSYLSATIGSTWVAQRAGM
jgi:hypothetical protein